jgi:hypothetical protein
MGLGWLVVPRLWRAAAAVVIAVAAGSLALPALAQQDADSVGRQPLILGLKPPSYEPPASTPLPSARPLPPPIPNPNVRPPAPAQQPDFVRNYDEWRSGSTIGGPGIGRDR